jgi:serine/threonine protein kinase
MESFKHKNIIRCLNSYVYENKFYTVMDCALGGELGKYIEKHKTLKEADAMRIFRQVHDAVKYIHSRSVIHRDIKPNNLLFIDEKCENIVVSLLRFKLNLADRFRNFRVMCG